MKTLNLIKTSRMIMAMALIGIFGLSTASAKDKAPKTPKMTIVEIASADQNFSILVEAVVKADLAGALSADGPYTVFAPTNEAFENLFEALGVSGISDLTKDQLTPILLYHVVSGKVMAADVSTGDVPTLNSDADLMVKASKEGVKINKTSTVIATDIVATNGVIHVIDVVLVPTTNDKASKSSGGSCN